MAGSHFAILFAGSPEDYKIRIMRAMSTPVSADNQLIVLLSTKATDTGTDPRNARIIANMGNAVKKFPALSFTCF